MSTDRAALRDARSRALLQRSILDDMIEALDRALAEPASPTPSKPHDLVAPCVAAEAVGVDESTIRRWAREDGIGERDRGRWLISVARARKRARAQ